ncbi:MAG: DNA gyrase inhibitor YacG [Proteobacteria bacterium]|jgi:endogenous inhibitor of DNA gyrase (YacG/DUF329 family)|nr:DNA gyrase inhibitor YacG [Pseudomonadota bacterium]MDA1238856.1 DNA gyrase inhibitor YacG [Pseudomonadota bacterium]
MSCPICKKISFDDYKPFCSKRCSDIDLSRWISGSYVVPGPALEDENEIINGEDTF